MGLANGGRKARRVNPNDLLKIVIHAPDRAEQSRIADALQVATCELKLLHDTIKSLRIQKRGLMQQLLTGQVRVSRSLLKKGAAE